MSDSDENLDKAWCYYNRVKNALTGLFEILTMNLDENDIFYQCAVDNLKQLKETIVDLLKHDYDADEIKRKLRYLEFDMKKCLFFSSDKENSEDKKDRKEDGLAH